MLPQRKSKILNINFVNDLLHLTLLTDCFDENEIKSWIEDFQEINKTTYTIKETVHTTGVRVQFKQYLRCHHNTRSLKLCDEKKPKITGIRNRPTKNTNCPSRITISLHSFKSNYKGKEKMKQSLLKEVPCEIYIVATHNHSTDIAALRYRKVSEEVSKKLIELFHAGHSIPAALEAIKADICLNYDDYETRLADRRYCPDYSYAYQLYIKEVNKAYGTYVSTVKNDNTGIQALKNEVDEHEIEIDENYSDMIMNKNCNETTINEMNEDSNVIKPNEMNQICSKINFTDINENCNETIINETIENCAEPIINDIGDFAIEEVQEDLDAIRIRGEIAISNLVEILQQHLEKSPVQMVDALEKMVQINKRLPTTSAFVSACLKFGSG